MAGVNPNVVHALDVAIHEEFRRLVMEKWFSAPPAFNPVTLDFVGDAVTTAALLACYEQAVVNVKENDNERSS